MITTSSNNGLEKGDIIRTEIDNGFWKVLYHFIFRKNLRRYNTYTISCFHSGTCFEVEENATHTE